MLFELLLLPIAVEYATDLSQTTVTYFSRKVCTYHLQKDLLNDNQRSALSLSLAFIWKISKATFLKHPRICSSKKRKHYRASIMVNIQTKRHIWTGDGGETNSETSVKTLSVYVIFFTNNMQACSSPQTMQKRLLHKQYSKHLLCKLYANFLFTSDTQTCNSSAQTMGKHRLLLKQYSNISLHAICKTSSSQTIRKHLFYKQETSCSSQAVRKHRLLYK